MAKPPTLEDRLQGVLLGTAVGDALGLPAEGLSRTAITARWKGGWKHRFVAGRGMVSDDTELTVLTALSLLEHPMDPTGFQRAFARRLRWWILALPAGVGLATARATLRLWLGVPPKASGAMSAGNGAAMRSAVLGVFHANDRRRRKRFVEASTEVTHRDKRALLASQAVAEIAALATRGDMSVAPGACLLGLSDDPDWRSLVQGMIAARAAARSVSDYAADLGLAEGVSGYAYHTVPLAIYAWWRHRGTFEPALVAALECGGDTDTVGAITGALAGADLGARAIPGPLVEGLLEWPRSVRWMRALAKCLAEAGVGATAVKSPAYPVAGVPLRNAVFLVLVLAHGLRRLVP